MDSKTGDLTHVTENLKASILLDFQGKDAVKATYIMEAWWERTGLHIFFNEMNKDHPDMNFSATLTRISANLG